MEVNRQMLARVLIQGAGMEQGWSRDGAGMEQGWSRDGAAVSALAFHQCVPGSIIIFIIVIVIIIIILILNMELVVSHHYSG